MRAIVVIPTYNERDNLAPLVGGIQRYVKDLDILIVDDNSPDGTGTLAEQLSREHPGKLFVLHRARKAGLGPAYVEGFRYALRHGYDVILQMDADLSHHPRYLPIFLEQIRSCDLVSGSRFLRGISVINWDLKRLILSRLATIYVRFITRVPFTDTTTGFKCWRREVLEAIEVETTFSNGYCFLIETTYRAYRRGFTVVEVPIIFVERKLGESKLSWNIFFEAFWGVLRLRLQRQRPVSRAAGTAGAARPGHVEPDAPARRPDCQNG